MLLLRTVCYTDWKGRPDHRVTFIADGYARKAILAAMDKDVAKWMANDLACIREGELEETGEAEDFDADAYAAELLATKSQAELKDLWEEEHVRWEMVLQDADHREFSQVSGEGEYTTTVYHILTDAHEYTERQ